MKARHSPRPATALGRGSAGTASDKIRQRVEIFVREIEELVREAALEAVAEALGAHVPSQPTRQASNGRGKAASQKAIAKRGAKKAPSETTPRAQRGPTKRVRRTEQQIDTDTQNILQYVAKHPGERAEEIKQALGLSTQQWALPVKRLLSGGKLSARGERRSTTYALG